MPIYRLKTGATDRKDSCMARKTNFSFEKRQKELAKKAKKEEKKQRKLEASTEEAVDEDGQPDDSPAETTED